MLKRNKHYTYIIHTYILWFQTLHRLHTHRSTVHWAISLWAWQSFSSFLSFFLLSLFFSFNLCFFFLSFLLIHSKLFFFLSIILSFCVFECLTFFLKFIFQRVWGNKKFILDYLSPFVPNIIHLASKYCCIFRPANRWRRKTEKKVKKCLLPNAGWQLNAGLAP